MIHIKNSNKQADYKKTIADFERPFKCTCCCLWRPIMTAYYHDDAKKKKKSKTEEKEGNKIRSQHLMGRVEELFTCSPELHVYGENGEIRWKIMGEYCQWGFAVVIFPSESAMKSIFGSEDLKTCRKYT